MNNDKPTYSDLENRIKQLETELEKERVKNISQNFFQLMFENIPLAIFLTSETATRVDYINPYFTKLMGYTLEDIPTVQRFQELAYPNEEFRIKRQLELRNEIFRLRQNNEKYYSISNSFVTCKDGTVKELALQGYLDETRVFGCMYDLTEQKKLEKALILSKEKAEESENRLKLATISGKLGIWDWNVKENTMIWDDRMFELYGIKQDTFPNTLDAWTNGLHPEDKQKAIDDCNSALKGEKDFNTTFRIVQPSGNILYIKADGLVIRDFENKPIRMIGINKDITNRTLDEIELIKAKEKTEESEMQLQSLFNNIKDAIGISQNGISLKVNNAYVEMFGYQSENEIIGKPLLNQISPKEHEKLKNFIANRYSNPNLPQYYETIGVKKNGEEFPLEVHVGIYEINKKTFSFGVLRDITERIKTNTELIAAKEKAEESNRLKSSFLQNMSHEVRTPLNAIQGFSQLIAKLNQSPEKLKKFAEIITESSEKLIGIVTDVIEISQIHTNQANVKLSTNNCKLFINEKIKAHFSIKAKEKNILLEFAENCPCTNNKVCTDFEKLNRIITHLIDNAIKFTIKGSVKISCCLKENQLQVTITDTGIGISEEMQKVIFEPFRQVENGITRNFGGNGLGLALVKSYVELLKGKIVLQPKFTTKKH